MSGTSKNVPNESKGSLKPQIHTYTPRSHEELLKKFSRYAIKSEDVKYLKRENENLKRELNTSNRQLKRLHNKISVLESNKKKEVKPATSSFLNKLPESQSGIESEIDVDTDEYVKSWDVLGHHFSEVIRRHHEVLAEKDRQIRALQEQQHNNKGISNKVGTSKMNENTISGMPTNIGSYENSKHFVQGQLDAKFENGGKGLQDRSEAGPSKDYQSADQLNCTELSLYKGDNLTNSGEILSEHFSEVIRRHKQQLLEKDRHIQELQEALECCQWKKSPKKQPNASEVQMWYHDYYHSQPSFGTQNPIAKSPSPSKLERHRNYSDDWDSDTSQHMPVPSSSDEEEGSLLGSADTFVAIDKCQRLESIANLERLRQNLIQRLEMEEKLDKIYWQTELNRYRELREEAGDSFDLDSPFNKEFEMLEMTRLELLRALKDVKDSAEREPEMYVKSHLPVEDSDSIVSQDIQFPESESKRRVTFTEQVTITKQTTYDS